MSGAYAINRPRVFDYELIESDDQRRQRARAIHVIYALADPRGWDARRHFPGDQLLAALDTHPRSHAR